MTPKEKALDIAEKMGFIVGELMALNYVAKSHALIAVDEVLSVACPDTFACKSYTGDFYSDQDYFIEVKKEIEKL